MKKNNAPRGASSSTQRDKIIIIKENKEYRKYVRVSSEGQIITLDSDGNEHISDALDFEIVST